MNGCALFHHPDAAAWSIIRSFRTAPSVPRSALCARSHSVTYSHVRSSRNKGKCQSIVNSFLKKQKTPKRRCCRSVVASNANGEGGLKERHDYIELMLHLPVTLLSWCGQQPPSPLLLPLLDVCIVYYINWVSLFLMMLPLGSIHCIHRTEQQHFSAVYTSNDTPVKQSLPLFFLSPFQLFFFFFSFFTPISNQMDGGKQAEKSIDSYCFRALSLMCHIVVLLRVYKQQSKDP